MFQKIWYIICTKFSLYISEHKSWLFLDIDIDFFWIFFFIDNFRRLISADNFRRLISADVN